MKKLTKKAVKEMYANDYTLLYKPMPEAVKKLFPVVTVAIASEYFGIHFTEKHTGKMLGFESWSTTCKASDLCISKIDAGLRKATPDFKGVKYSSSEEIKAAKKALRDYIKANPEDTTVCICGFCFSDSQQDYQSSMTPTLARNFEILNNGIIHSDYLPVLNDLYFRGESFGDFASVNAVRNFINLARKNPLTRFAIWSKNLLYFTLAFREMEKPENVNIVKSSAYVNRPVKLTAAEKEYVDVVFTVYSKEYAKHHGIAINCGALACLTCLKCYKKHDGVIYINEALK